MKFVLMLLMVAMIIPAVCTAETRVLTLDQALAIASEKNRDVEKAREYANYVQGKYVEERAAAFPQLSLNGSVMVAKDGSQELAGFPAQRQFYRAVDLTLSQPLYTWGKLNAAIRAAEVGRKTADEQLRLYRQAAYRDVVTAYRDIQLARELSGLAQENRAQKLRHLDEASRKFTAGVATDYDVLAAEVAAENTQPEVIRAENSIRLARERLRFLLALGSDEVDVTGSLDAPVNDRPLPANYEEAVRIAGTRRPELSDLRLRIGIYGELVTIADSEDKPRLDFKAGAGWHWSNLGDPSPALGADGPAWNAGIYLTFPFFDGLRTSSKVVQAKSDLKTKQLEEAKLLDAISLEVRQAEFSWLEAAKIYTALTGTVKQAERLVQMAEKGYEFGVKIRLEVEDAQLNLLQAKSNLARAQRDYRVAQVNYLWATGVAGE
jgi:HAE1 family hydrophobic/amphiphilic exporter-1